jgi:hypothetical protein
MTNLTDFEGASKLSTIEDCNLHLVTPLSSKSNGLTPLFGDSTSSTQLFQLALKSRHMRSHPQLPLTTPGVDLEKIIRKGKTPQEGTSTYELGDSHNFHNLPSETPVTIYISPIIPFPGVSKTLNFMHFSTDFSSLGLFLGGERFNTPISPEVVSWLIPSTLG